MAAYFPEHFTAGEYIMKGPAAPGRNTTNTGRARVARRRAVMAGVWLALAGFTPVKAEIANVRVAGATATQAIIAYTAPDENACTMEVSESADFRPLAHDVDPALFASADRDDRAGNLVTGRARLFVAGARVAQEGLDHKYYSRALQNRTTHYFRITCGTDTATGSFDTADWPLGLTYNEPIPADPSKAGVTAWPQLSWNDRSETVIDPQTGMLIKRMTFPKMEKVYSSGYAFYSFAYASGANWTGAASALADDDGWATYSGTTRDALKLSSDFAVPRGMVVDGLQVGIKGCVADGATGEDRDVEVALSIDGGISAYGKWLPVTLSNESGCSGAERLAGDAADPVPVMSAWLNTDEQPPSAEDLSLSTGYARLAGTRADYYYTTISAPFGLNWGKGAQILVCSDHPCTGRYVPYTVDTVNSALTLTTAEDMGTAAVRAWKAPMFVVMIRKKTASAHQVRIQHARFGMWFSAGAGFNGGAGSTSMCAPRTRPDRNGKAGYHCATQTSYPNDWLLWWIAPSDGEVRYLGPIWTSGADWNLHICSQSGVSWDISDPTYDALYCTVPSKSAPGKLLLLKGAYKGDNTDAGLQPGAGSSAVQALWQWTNLTPVPNDLIAQVKAFDPSFDATLFNGLTTAGTQDGKVILYSRAGYQNSMGWNVVYDPSPQVNAVVGAMNSWSRPPARWCGIHTSFAWGDAKWMMTAGYDLNGNGGNYSGPFRTTTTGTLSATFSPCPANELGVTGNQCSTVTISGEPETPANATPARWQLQQLAAGDVLDVLNASGAPDGEWVRVIAKAGLTLTLQRGFSKDHAAKAHPAGTVLQPICGAVSYDLVNYYSEPASNWWWDFNNDPHGTNSGDPYALEMDGATVMRELVLMGMTHATNRLKTTISDGPGTLPGTPMCTSTSIHNSAYGIRTAEWSSATFKSAPPYCLGHNPPFSGTYGMGTGNGVERHPSYDQSDLTAPNAARSWFLDARPLNVYQDYPLTVVPVTGQLYKVTKVWHERPDWKRVQLFAQTGYQPLREVSAPMPFTISSGPQDSYKYCVALRAGECYPGSQADEIYVNVPQHSGHPPSLPYGDTCIAKDMAYANSRDICLGLLGAHADSIAQYGLTGRDEFYGRYSRRLTNGLHVPKATDKLWNARPLPDGSWIFLPNAKVNGARAEVLLVKTPPFPQADSVNRGDFVPIEVLVDAPEGSDNAVVEFGYDTSFRCTGRDETCVAVSASGAWPGSAPYYFASESYTGVACASGCTVAIPAIAERVLYYRVKYRDADGNVLATSGTNAVAVP